MSPTTVCRHPVAGRNSPFCLDNAGAYQRWRDTKLRMLPASADHLIVHIDDPRRLRPAERGQIQWLLQRSNMAVFVTRPDAMDRSALRTLAAQFGLLHLDQNFLADDDGISQIRVASGGDQCDFIPYTDQALSWHTDGYYNPPGLAVRALLLHCVRAAASGGANALLDHELAYIGLRDADPRYISALSAPGAMTIPARRDARGVARDAQSGPVFSVDPVTGRLHMRYSARTRSIVWQTDGATQSAIACLRNLLIAGQAQYHVRLEPGMGLICANVLHNRSGFRDDPSRPRLLYRARYFDPLDFGVTHGDERALTQGGDTT